MCFISNSWECPDWQKADHLFDGNDEIVCYKLVEVSRDNGKKRYRTPYMDKSIRLGRTYQSSRKGRSISPTERSKGVIRQGIHVYHSLAEAKDKVYGPSREVIKVICKRADHVAHNKEEAVFTKVKYTKEIAYCIEYKF